MPDRPVSRSKIDLAKKELQINPVMAVTEFREKYGLSKDTAYSAVNKAREELRKNDEKIAERAMKVREKQVVKALDALEIQMVRLETLPGILQALRRDTFKLNSEGEVIGIKKQIKGFSKAGDRIYNSPGAIVSQYLAAEAQILSEERIVTGIEAAEKAETATAGKTELTLAVPLSSEDIKAIKPVE